MRFETETSYISHQTSFLYQALHCHTYFVIHSEGIALQVEVLVGLQRLEVQTEAAVRAAGHRDELAVEQARVAL